MNRKNLTAAVLAGLAGAAGIVGSAQAVNINPDGLGQVLIYPYYTTNGLNQTVLSVVNTTDFAKAVKVRFKEGKNSREVLDFNLYMSPWDVWTASISRLDETPFLVTNDTTCTVPYLYGNGGKQDFLPYAMNDTGNPDELGPISRATEGYFEMIEMGVLTNEDEGSAAAAKHDPDTGMPDDCGQLARAWTIFDDRENDIGYWLENPLQDIEAPIGGLFGGAAIVNVVTGYMVSYEAKAIERFADRVDPDLEPLHNPPGDSSPSLNSGGLRRADVFANGVVVNSGILDRGVDAVSFVFMHDAIMNEYTTELAVAASTEWVMTFPTKAYYVYGEEAGGEPGEILDDEDVLPPFTTAWDGDGACEVVLLTTIWDREEQSIFTEIPPGNEIPPIVSPRPPGVIDPVNPLFPFQLCYETSVISFGENSINELDKTRILGSSNWHKFDNEELGFEYGWASIRMDRYPYDRNGNGFVDFDNPNADDTEEYPTSEAELNRDPLGTLQGLPVTGFSVNRFLNLFTGPNNELANYGGIFQHKGTRKLSSNAVFCDDCLPGVIGIEGEAD